MANTSLISGKRMAEIPLTHLVKWGFGGGTTSSVICYANATFPKGEGFWMAVL